MASYDWKMTEDGDLDVGLLRTDEEGNQLYIGLDKVISTEKEEGSKELRDIGYVYDLESDKQIIMNRLRTENPDWFHHMAMGANLSDLIGMPNTRATSEVGIENIKISLLYKELYKLGQLNISATPVSINQILFEIVVEKYNNRIVEIPILFDLETGVSNIYELEEEEILIDDDYVEEEIKVPVEEPQEDTGEPLTELDVVPVEPETDDVVEDVLQDNEGGETEE